jgi:hypothetical protein
MLFESFSTSFNATSWLDYLSMPCEVALKSVKESFKNQIFPVLRQLLRMNFMLKFIKLIFVMFFFSVSFFVHGQEESFSSYIQLVKNKNKKKALRHQQNPTPPESPRPSSFYDPLVDYYLRNKIILCTGPALGRYEMLKKSTEDDLKLIPFKKIFITTNEPKIVRMKFNEGKIIPSRCYLIPDRGQQVDCTNCIISSLRHAVNDPDVLDDDIILFKHESLYINDMELINRAINKIVNEGYDMVNRRPVPACGGIVTCTDAFYVRVSAIRKIVENYPDITELPAHEWFCELYFHENIVKHIPAVYSIFYCHNNGGPTELGFYHYPARKDPFWDKSNYDELY